MKLPPHKTFTFPRFYFDGGYEHMGGLPSDRKWITSYLSVIPEDRKHEVCEEYERIYLASPINMKRELANKFLYNEALKYRHKKSGDEK